MFALVTKCCASKLEQLLAVATLKKTNMGFLWLEEIPGSYHVILRAALPAISWLPWHDNLQAKYNKIVNLRQAF